MIYFDNSATTPIDKEVLATYEQISTKFIGNPSSLHKLGNNAHAMIAKAREQIANLLDVATNEIVFTSGGTEGNNMIIKGTALAKANYGKHILYSSIEHPSVVEPVEQLAKLGFEVEQIPVTNEGIVDLEALKKALRPETILVSVMAVNNEIGTCQPIQAISEILEEYPRLHFHVDAVQAVGKVPTKEYLTKRVDFATFSGHKFHAPKGTGFIYHKFGKTLEPLLAGGGQEGNLRSGTENVAGIVALSKALRLTLTSYAEKKEEIREFNQLLRTNLAQLANIKIYTPTVNVSPYILALGIKGIRGEVLLHALEEHEIYVSTTSACSSNKKIKRSTLKAMGVANQDSETVIRISLSNKTTLQEIEQFNRVFKEVYQKLNQINN